ncbi:hypothetical protein PMIN04_005991 [Paraphaeosphaeria minitans]
MTTTRRRARWSPVNMRPWTTGSKPSDGFILLPTYLRCLVTYAAWSRCAPPCPARGLSSIVMLGPSFIVMLGLSFVVTLGLFVPSPSLPFTPRGRASSPASPSWSLISVVALPSYSLPP